MADTTIAPYQFTIDAAIAEWLAQKETRTGSRKTRQAYEERMRQFRDFLTRGGLDLLSNPIDTARVAALWANQRTGNTRRPGEDVSPRRIISAWLSCPPGTRLCRRSTSWTFLTPLRVSRNDQCKPMRQHYSLTLRR